MFVLSNFSGLQADTKQLCRLKKLFECQQHTLQEKSTPFVAPNPKAQLQFSGRSNYFRCQCQSSLLHSKWDFDWELTLQFDRYDRHH
jgi:hypothetical protein